LGDRGLSPSNVGTNNIITFPEIPERTYNYNNSRGNHKPDSV